MLGDSGTILITNTMPYGMNNIFRNNIFIE